MIEVLKEGRAFPARGLQGFAEQALSLGTNPLFSYGFSAGPNR